MERPRITIEVLYTEFIGSIAELCALFSRLDDAIDNLGDFGDGGEVLVSISLPDGFEDFKASSNE
jgi:hypothetical protein